MDGSSRCTREHDEPGFVLRLSQIKGPCEVDSGDFERSGGCASVSRQRGRRLFVRLALDSIADDARSQHFLNHLPATENPHCLLISERVVLTPVCPSFTWASLTMSRTKCGTFPFLPEISAGRRMASGVKFKSPDSAFLASIRISPSLSCRKGWNCASLDRRSTVPFS